MIADLYLRHFIKHRTIKLTHLVPFWTGVFFFVLVPALRWQSCCMWSKTTAEGQKSENKLCRTYHPVSPLPHLKVSDIRMALKGTWFSSWYMSLLVAHMQLLRCLKFVLRPSAHWLGHLTRRGMSVWMRGGDSAGKPLDFLWRFEIRCTNRKVLLFHSLP